MVNGVVGLAGVSVVPLVVMVLRRDTEDVTIPGLNMVAANVWDMTQTDRRVGCKTVKYMVDGVSGLRGHDVVCHVMEVQEQDVGVVTILDLHGEAVPVLVQINI